MMKNKLSVGMFWLLAFAFLLNSCRQDLLLDEEQKHNNNSQFQLTSKRISLKESRHKDKLTPILQKTTSELRKVKNISAFGKTVSYGNGVSIDTDDVIFVENGNYHNYVFRINKENKVEGDPIDNLLLTPLPDGSYQEFLVQYHISEQELELFGKGNYTIPKEKIKVTELASGTYNNGQLIQNKAQICDYLTVLAGYTPCGANKHFAGEGGEDCNEAKVGNGSKPIYVTFRSCTDVETGLPPGWEQGGGGGNPSQGGGGSVCTDCPPETNTPCVELPTNPMDPSFGVGGNGCNVGLPFLPNLPLTNPATDPCRVAKIPAQEATNILKNNNIAPQVNAMKNHALNSNVEYGFTIVSNNGTLSASEPFTDNNPGQVGISAPATGDYVANGHNHPGDMSPPSCGDFYSALYKSVNYPYFTTTFVFSHNGNIYAIVLNNKQKATDFLAQYPDTENLTENKQLFNEKSDFGKKFNEIYNDFNEGRAPSYSGSSQKDGLETALVHVLEKYDTGISIAKQDASGNFKPLKAVSFNYTIPASGGKKVTAYKTETCP